MHAYAIISTFEFKCLFPSVNIAEYIGLLDNTFTVTQVRKWQVTHRTMEHLDSFAVSRVTFCRCQDAHCGTVFC